MLHDVGRVLNGIRYVMRHGYCDLCYVIMASKSGCGKRVRKERMFPHRNLDCILVVFFCCFCAPPSKDIDSSQPLVLQLLVCSLKQYAVPPKNVMQAQVQHSRRDRQYEKGCGQDEKGQGLIQSQEGSGSSSVAVFHF